MPVERYSGKTVSKRIPIAITPAHEMVLMMKTARTLGKSTVSVLGVEYKFNTPTMKTVRAKGLTCKYCRAVGNVFVLEKDNEKSSPTFRLYKRSGNDFLPFTPDLIIPRSLGGPSIMANSAMKCNDCFKKTNIAQGASLDKDEVNRTIGLIQAAGVMFVPNGRLLRGLEGNSRVVKVSTAPQPKMKKQLLVLKASKFDGQIRKRWNVLAVATAEDTITAINESIARGKKAIRVLGHESGFGSETMKMFLKKGIECSSCGLVGNLFALEQSPKMPPCLTLYHHSDGKYTMLTKDHIIPRSKYKGPNVMQNYTPMCAVCNARKGNTLGDLEEVREVLKQIAAAGHHYAPSSLLLKALGEWDYELTAPIKVRYSGQVDQLI